MQAAAPRYTAAPSLRDLSASTLRSLTAALPQLYSETDPEKMARAISDSLSQLVPGESHGVIVADRTSGKRSISLRPASSDHERLLPVFFQNFHQFAPADFRGATHCGDALALSDFIARPSLGRMALFADYYQRIGVEDDLSILVERGSTAICAAVLRRRRGFRRDERALMNALRPHFGQAWANAQNVADLKARATRAPVAASEWQAGPLVPALGLTPREADVLLWVAQGKTNGEVGTILGIRPYTVRTHLERVFAKLGVETRHAAALSAIEVLGLPANS